LIDKKNERATRQIIDIKELQLKLKNYKQKDDIFNMIMEKKSIDSRKIKSLVKSSKLFEDLGDDQFQVLKLIEDYFADKNTLNTLASGDKKCQKTEKQINDLQTEKKKLEFHYSTYYHHQKPNNVNSQKRKNTKAHQPQCSSKNYTDILQKVNEALNKNKDNLNENPSKKSKLNIAGDNQTKTTKQANIDSNQTKQIDTQLLLYYQTLSQKLVYTQILNTLILISFLLIFLVIPIENL
jgi:hypothetical protein